MFWAQLDVLMDLGRLLGTSGVMSDHWFGLKKAGTLRYKLALSFEFCVLKTLALEAVARALLI